MEQGKSNAGMIVLTVVITAIVVGGGVYLWQNNKMGQPETEREEQQATQPTQSQITETSDYAYNINTGKLTSKKDSRVIYTFLDGGETDTFAGKPAVYIYGLDGNKLILWQTGSDNSPGPVWEYEIWLKNELVYLDLTNPSQGPKPYMVPEWKKQEAKEFLEGMW